VNLPLFIARRIARPSEENRPGVMVRIATLAVAVSLAVMLLSLAVITGFKREVTRKIAGFSAHVEVTGRSALYRYTSSSQPVRRTEALEKLLRESPGCRTAAPFAAEGGIMKTPEAMQGILLKGVDAAYDWSFMREVLVEGELPRTGDSVRTKDVLLSRMAARKLQVKPGDKVEMLFIESDAAPRRDRFKVSGLYDSGMEEMDNLLAFTDLRNVQRLLGWRADEVSGYELWLDDLHGADPFADRLAAELFLSQLPEAENLGVDSISERFPMLFDWLRTHDVNAVVILTIMLVVALFNMISALLILVLERTRMIGLLKALGMNDGQLQRIFLYRASFIILKGMTWGNAVGLALCLIQKYGHVMKLDASGYLLSEVPIAVEWGWWLALNFGTAALILLLLSLPAYIVSYIRPEQSIRYE